MPFLRLDRQRGNWACLEPTQRDRLACFFAIPVGAIIDARERFVDFRDQLALAVASAQLYGAIGFGRGTVCEIWMILIFLLKMLQRFLGLLEYVLSPHEQLGAKIIALAFVHERLFVRRPVVFGFGQHSHLLPGFCSWAPCTAPSERQAYIRPSTGGQYPNGISELA